MKDFILTYHPSGSHERVNIPGYSEDQLLRHDQGIDVKFAGWNREPGDVHIAANGDASALILNGYITKMPFKGSCERQDETAKRLLEMFDSSQNVSWLSQIMPRLYGSFSIVYMNRRAGKLILVSDRVASRPIWYAVNKKFFAVSTNAPLIAKQINSTSYDHAGLGSFLLYGTQLDPEISLYEGVRAIPEATVSFYSQETGLESREWYHFNHTPERNLNDEAALDLVSGRLKNAAERVLKVSEKPMMFLSGGIDSRLMTSAICAAGGNPLLVTIGSTKGYEQSVAKKVASRFNCTHQIIPGDHHWYLNALKNGIQKTNGAYIWTHGHFSSAYDKAKTSDHIASAFLGDFSEAFSKIFCNVSDSMTRTWTPVEFAAQFDQLVPRRYQPANPARTLCLLNPEFTFEVKQKLQEEIVRRYVRLRDISQDPKIVGDHFFRWQSVASLPTFYMLLDIRSRGPERNIMFEPDVHELLEILPSSIRDGRNFGARLVQKLWPSAYDVVNSNTMLPMSVPRPLQQFTKAARARTGRIVRSISKTSRSMGSWTYLPPLYLTDADWFSFFNSIFTDASEFPEDIFDVDSVRQCWRSFCDGDMSRHGDIEKLVQIHLLNSYMRGNGSHE